MTADSISDERSIAFRFDSLSSSLRVCGEILIWILALPRFGRPMRLHHTFRVSDIATGVNRVYDSPMQDDHPNLFDQTKAGIKRKRGRDAMRRYRQRAKGTLRAKELRRRFTLNSYGIAECGYQEILIRQGGTCAICKTESPGGRYKALNIDHDHTTGKIRGLLCHKCNLAIGYFGDSLENLQSAMTYLRLWESFPQPTPAGDDFVKRQTKLNESSVLIIHALVRGDTRYDVISRLMGISQGVISSIVNGKRWQRVRPIAPLNIRHNLTEEVALAAVGQFRSAPVTILDLPARRALPSPERVEAFDEFVSDDDEDDDE